LSGPIVCLKCGRDFGGVEKRRGFISLFVMGDEEIQSWFFCEACQVWTVEEYLDRFLGESSISFRGPIEREAGEKQVARIRECPDPADKWCECPVHREMGP